MDDGQALTEIDRVLAAALDVEASADFAAGVRQRIAREPRRTPAFRHWRIALPLAAVAIVAIAISLAFALRGTSTTQRLAARPVSLPLMRSADVTTDRSVATVANTNWRRRVKASTTRAPAVVRQPEVLVPREEIEMYRRLITTAQQITGAIVVEAVSDVVAVPSVSHITIDPIRIDLITPSAGGEGDRQ